MEQFLQQIINGLSWGAIYALIAVGYTMVYGVLRLINFAHGDVYMIGAMIGLFVATAGFDIFAASHQHPAAILVLLCAAPATLAALLLCKTLHKTPHWSLQVSALTFWIILAVMLITDLGGRLVRLIGTPSFLALLIVLICAMLVCALLGLLIERVAYRPLRNQPRLTALITAIGVSMFLEFGGQRLFGATPRAFPVDIVPPLLPGSPTAPASLGHVLFMGDRIVIANLSITGVDLLIFLLTLALMLLLRWIVMNTRTGMALRAVSFRFDTAALMGINTDRIIAFTFALGSALAAVAGILVALRAPKVDPLMGLIPGIKAFVAAVLGGIGNINGAVAGAFLLGLIEVLVAGYLDSQYKDGVAFVILIAVLLIRPAGLLGDKTIEKV